MNRGQPKLRRVPIRRRLLAWQPLLVAGLAMPAGVMAADRKGPDAPRDIRVAQGEKWNRHGRYTISWSNPAHSRRFKAAEYRLCRVEPQLDCRNGKRGGLDPRRLELQVTEPGEYTLTVRLKDAKGRIGQRSRTVRLRFDDEPPTSQGFKRGASRDPRELVLVVKDGHSGPSRVDIQMRRVGDKWKSLDTSSGGDGEFRVRVPELEVPPGKYELRALMRDAAGNLAVIDHDTKGASMRLRLPLRKRTALTAVAHTTRSLRRCRRAVGPRAGRPTRRLRCTNVTMGVSVPMPTSAPVRLAHGQRVVVTGVLKGVSGRRPRIDVTERPRSPGFTPVTRSVTADSSGRFSIMLEPGPSRTVELSYAGDERSLPARTEAGLLVPAASALIADRRFARNGETVVFSGRLLGGPVPAIGRTVDLQAYYRGAWRTFATPRTDAGGAWQYAYRFGATAGRVTYPFRVVIQREAGYPYETGISRTVRVTVRGR